MLWNKYETLGTSGRWLWFWRDNLCVKLTKGGVLVFSFDCQPQTVYNHLEQRFSIAVQTILRLKLLLWFCTSSVKESDERFFTHEHCIRQLLKTKITQPPDRWLNKVLLDLESHLWRVFTHYRAFNRFLSLLDLQFNWLWEEGRALW